MKNVAKKLFVGLGTAFTAVLLSFFLYDFTQFAPHRDGIQSILNSAEEGDRNPPAQVVRLLKASLNDRTSDFATRLIMAELGVPPIRKMGIRRTLWIFLVALHYSEKDRITIILSKAYTGSGRTGVSATSRALYKKELSQLSLDEAATIIVLTMSSGYKDALPGVRQRMKERLIEKSERYNAST